MNGIPALRADTPEGTLLVARKPPYRVLRLEPFDLSEHLDKAREQLENEGELPSPPPGDAQGRHFESDGMDLDPLTGGEVAQMYDTLQRYVKQLETAVDDGVDFILDIGGELNCSAGGCTVREPFTGTLTTDAKTRVKGGKVNATLTATLTIDGRPAGGCTSRGLFSVIGNRASGTLTCSAPEAGPVFAAVDAEYQARAQAAADSVGGRVTKRFQSRANAVVEARVFAVTEVKRMLDRLRHQREATACVSTNSFAGDTPVLMADGSTRPISAVRPGDQVLAADVETGQIDARAVTAIQNSAKHGDLVDLTIGSGRLSETVRATPGHLFWDPGTRTWTKAADLNRGDRLHGDDGQAVRVTLVDEVENVRSRLYDLSVDQTHTYFVGTEDASTLVHNRPPGACSFVAGPKAFEGRGGSKTFANGNASKKDEWRVDVENVGPGRKGANVHFQFKRDDEVKYYYHPDGRFVTANGTVLRSKYREQIPEDHLTKALRYLDVRIEVVDKKKGTKAFVPGFGADADKTEDAED